MISAEQVTKLALLFALALAPHAVHAQSAYQGTAAEFTDAMSDLSNVPVDISNMGDADIENQGLRQSVSDANESAANSAIDMGTTLSAWGIETVQSASEFLDTWRALSDTDERCTLTDPGPQIPSSCGEPGTKCYTCYERATSALNANRRNLHRAWCITHTNLSMAKSAIAFGDTSSGVHGVAGLSWSLGGKPQIEEAMRDLRATYDRRQGDFIRAIDGNLQTLGKCEAEHFNEVDWYTRFGYLYLDHLRTRYKSAEP